MNDVQRRRERYAREFDVLAAGLSPLKRTPKTDDELRADRRAMLGSEDITCTYTPPDDVEA